MHPRYVHSASPTGFQLQGFAAEQDPGSPPFVCADVLFVGDQPRVSRLTFPALPATPLCFTLLDDSSPSTPALLLLAFPTTHLPEGTLAAPPELLAAGYTTSERAGALRWLAGSGVVHQVETSPAFRRQRVATRLLWAADALCAVHSWPGIHGGEERSEEGNALIESLAPVGAARTDTWERSALLTP